MKNLFICFFAFLQISSYSQIEPYELDTQINLTDYYLTQLENCNEEHDIYMELYPGFGVEYVVIESIEDPENRMVVSEKEDFKAEMFGLKSNGKNNLNFKIISLDANNNILEERQIKKSTIKQGQVTVSEGLFAYLHDMGHNNLDGGFGIPNNGGYGNVFTYFCGYNASKVELLAFFQDFLGLSPEQICEFQALFQLAQLNYETSEIITWTNIYCELLNQFWDIYINGFGNGGDEDCQCKVINSSVFIDHSIGAATGEPLEDCPDVGLDEDYQLWAHQGTFPGTNGEDNWWLTRWAKMGAAKSMQTTTHHYEGGFGGDDENKFMKKELYNTDLKSGIQFSMKCFKPHNAEIDPECDCEKEVKIDAQYVSRARGLAGTDGNIITNGNGSVRSCMEDFATFTKFTRTEFEVLEDGFTLFCLECNSTDSTNIFTDLGTLAGAIEDLVPGVIQDSFEYSQIDDYFNLAGDVFDLVSNPFMVSPDCFSYADTIYTLVDVGEIHTLTPDDDFVSYILTSKIISWTDFNNDEAYSDQQIISDYYIAAGLESSGDSTCCNEKVGGYLIGTLSEFDVSTVLEVDINDEKASYDGIEFGMKNPLLSGTWLTETDLYEATPNSLLRLQRDVASFFFTVHPDFLEDVFGIPPCPTAGCQAQVNCYFNCGYWGECHEEGDTFEGDPDLKSMSGAENEDYKLNFLHSDEVKISPNPIHENEDFHITMSGKYTEYAILSLDGKLISKSPVSGTSITINGDILNTGMNLIVLKKADGSFFIEKIIKQ